MKEISFFHPSAVRVFRHFVARLACKRHPTETKTGDQISPSSLQIFPLFCVEDGLSQISKMESIRRLLLQLFPATTMDGFLWLPRIFVRGDGKRYIIYLPNED